jgi:hypothetical protein
LPWTELARLKNLLPFCNNVGAAARCQSLAKIARRLKRSPIFNRYAEGMGQCSFADEVASGLGRTGRRRRPFLVALTGWGQGEAPPVQGSGVLTPIWSSRLTSAFLRRLLTEFAPPSKTYETDSRHSCLPACLHQCEQPAHISVCPCHPRRVHRVDGDARRVISRTSRLVRGQKQDVQTDVVSQILLPLYV